MSTLKCDGQPYPAFSGMGKEIDNKDFVSDKDKGPLPQGRYYIVDRQSGGYLGWLWEYIHKVFGADQSEWFALYRDDDKIDDQTVINGVTRGEFRLHPIGPRGISEGCILMNPLIFK